MRLGLVPTPPDQDYPSGHSIGGGAGAEIGRHGPVQLQGLWRNAASRQHVLRRKIDAAILHELHPGG